MKKLEEMRTGIVTINDVPSIVFLNFVRNNFKLDENGGEFSKRVETLWEQLKLHIKTKSPFPTVFSNICTVGM